MDTSGQTHSTAIVAPSKIIAVHTNFRSRAEQRGVLPTEPSYFLKPPSSVASDGAAVVRPHGCELLRFEGEIAIVIGTRARNVALAEAWSHIGAYAVANDFGVEELRWADRGSNLMSKGQDGYTPIGPRLVAADEVDPRNLRLRTYVNGELAQDDSTADLLFDFGLLVADLSRFVTLMPGDVILSGTPAGSRPVEPGDEVVVDVEGLGRLRTPVRQAETPMDAIGAMPRRQGAGGAPAAPRPVTLSSEAQTVLRSVSTATLTVQLRRRGIANSFLRGLRPARPDLRLLGYAHTLRYVPLREDLAAREPPGRLNAQKAAIEAIGPQDVLVIEARGELGAGTIGDILALRALRRGAAGIVTDGGLRDTPAVSALDIPTFYAASHAAVLGVVHHPLESNVPVACAGVTVLPGDVVVGDAEGVVVIPAAMAESVAHDAAEQERAEAWALERVDAGESVEGVYPMSPERRPEYDAWLAARADVGQES